MKILLIGKKKYIGRHFSFIESHFGESLKYFEDYNPNEIINEKPDLVIVPDEHWCELGNIIATCCENKILTLQLMDGILEWRRTWEYTERGHTIDGIVNPLNQPAFAHKISCLGYKDFKILESWGNYGKCEIVGIPRLKNIIGIRKDFKHLDNKKNKILICTAKTPGFTPEQLEITKESLFDLKNYFESRKDVEIIWRITGNLSEELDIENKLKDLSGQEIHEIIQKVDAVITTPSTTMIEAMVLKTPVALLDYHNTPHYFEAAWVISAKSHIPKVINELLYPPVNKLEYQNFLLREQLFLEEDSTKRLIRLIECMIEYKGRPDELPLSILDNSYSPSLILKQNIGVYYPDLSWLDLMDKKRLQLQLSAARGTIKILEQKNKQLEYKLNSIPFYNLARKIKRRFKIL